MSLNKTLFDFENIAREISYRFYLFYMEPEEDIDSEYILRNYCDPVGWDVSWVWHMGDDWSYFSLSEMYEILKNWYDRKTVLNYYEYGVYHSGKNREYWINIETFSKIWDGSEIWEWAEKYHKERDEKTAYWNSPEGKQKEQEQMEEIKQKFLIENGL